MGYRIRMVPEVAGWLGQLRDADPIPDPVRAGPGRYRLTSRSA
jgi:hypothetical protein